MKKEAKACKIKGKFKIIVGPANDGYNFSYCAELDDNAFENRGSGGFRTPNNNIERKIIRIIE